MAAALRWLFGKVRSIESKTALAVMGLSTSAYCGAWLFNKTEHRRIAKQISSGKLRPHSEHLNLKYCQLSIEKLNDLTVNTVDSFVGIVGVKSSGKSSTLELFADDPTHSNVVYITMTLGEEKGVNGALYAALRSSVYKLPWIFENVCPSHYSNPEYVINNVFRMVKNKTGKPVIAVIDLQPPENRSTNETQHLPFDRTSRKFVRDVKLLVSDRKVMKCLFASSENAGFLVEASREPRLVLFTTSELPWNTVEEYLQERNISIDPEICEMLSKVPLRFSILDLFCKQWKRGINEAKKFVDEGFAKQVSDLDAAIKKHPDSVKIYQTALNENGHITMRYLNQLSISLEQFQNLFVHSNIFSEQTDGCYKFQYLATQKAAKVLLEDISKKDKLSVEEQGDKENVNK